MNNEVRILKVKSNANVQSLAGCITACVNKGETVELHAIGAGAVNQMLKATIIARGYVAALGKNLAIIPGFGTIKGEENGDRTMIITKVVEV